MGGVRLRVFDPGGAAAAATPRSRSPPACPCSSARRWRPGRVAVAAGHSSLPGETLVVDARDARGSWSDSRVSCRRPLRSGNCRRPRCARRVPSHFFLGQRASWSASTSRPASGRSWPGPERRRASGSACAERLDHHVEGAAGGLDQQHERGARSPGGRPTRAPRGAVAASPATRIGGRRPPRTMRCEAARRETRPLPSSKGAISTIRARATAAACSGFRSREPAPSSHSSSVARRLGDELRRRGGRAVPLPLSAAETHRPRERLVPRPDPREAERRIGRHRGAGAAQREDFRRAFARDARGAHLVPGRADARELEAAEELRVLDDPRELRVVRSKATLLEQRREALLLHGRARLQAEALAHAAADSKGSRGVRLASGGSGLELCPARQSTIQDLTPGFKIQDLTPSAPSV